MKKTILTLDPVLHEPVIREMTKEERPLYYFGEAIGILLFRPWYQCIPTMGHVSFAPTYDFPVRLKFVDEFLDPDGYLHGRCGWNGWNLPEWIRCAQELQEEGVKAIVGGCGLTGSIQAELSAAVEIPVHTSSLLHVPEIHHGIADGKRVGILTVSEEQLRAHDNAVFKGCGIDETIPIAVAGMNESAGAETWLTMTTPAFDKIEVEKAVVNAALDLIEAYPDIGALVLECTDMPPYSAAIRKATGLPVFDAVDMVNRVYKQVGP